MHALSAWFTRNRVAANLLMMLILAAGFFTLKSMRIEGFPALSPDSVTVTTVFAGADAEQVDQGVSRRIETALEGMPGLKKISSYAEEAISIVRVQKVSGFDMDRFQNDIQSRIDAIYGFPQRAERPAISRDEFNVEALLVQVYGNTDRQTLQMTARRVKAELMTDPNISKMVVFGLLPYEVRIEVDDQKLHAFGLSIDDVAQAVSSASLDYRTGSIKSEAGEIVVRADKTAFNYADFIAVPVRTLPDGTRILIKDVAIVIDGSEDEELFARYQHMPSVGMMIYTSPKGHLIEVSNAAHAVLNRIRPTLPEGVYTDIWGEYSIYMKARLSLLATNAWQGLIIVFVLLALFLNLKMAFWVAVGIPISISGALVIMGDRFLGHSLNDITTFGFIVALGILVDDAVVVGESVFESRRRIKDPVEGTIAGVRKVSTATVFGCFTTVAAFYPLLLIDNDLGKIFAGFSVVVIISLLVSLVESKLILPAHLAAVAVDGRPSESLLPRWWSNTQRVFSWGLDTLNLRLYQPILTCALKHRYATLVVFLTTAVMGISLLYSGQVRTVFFPEVPGQIITVKLKMNYGSPLNLTVANVMEIERQAEAVNALAMDEYNAANPPIVRILTALTDPFNAEIYAELQPEDQRKMETMETLRHWRDLVGRLEGAEELSFSGSFETGGGFIVELDDRDEAALADAVDRFTDRLRELDGVSDVRDDLRQGRPQIRLHLKPEAQHLGLTTADLAQQFGDAFGGIEVQRMQRGAEEIKVIVKYQAQRRQYMNDILTMKIRTGTGEILPLSLVARVETGFIPASLHRQNGRRVVSVRASLDKGKISATEAFAWIRQQVEPELMGLYPGLTIRGAGELEEVGDIKAGMKQALMMIFLLIYALLATPLKSYWQPFVIMSVIPFGFVGAVLGHMITGFALSILSFFGMLAVMGVVVNDSLVLLTRFNQFRAEGLPLEKALIKAGVTRFRPIFLTTVTTVCGLIPLMLESSEQAQYLIPAAISLAYGELFATPITLIVIPVLIHVAQDVSSLGKSFLAWLNKDVRRA
ncbi:MAG: efflux RND transporter permease subunit [Desulfobacteraceae bacterium]|nr:efflux RND transporter permease subunit [Desulfobacteraceae bacterium]